MKLYEFNTFWFQEWEFESSQRNYLTNGKELKMKKAFEFLSVIIVVLLNLFIDALFAHLGWEILSKFLVIDYQISYPGWLMIMCFIKLIISGTGNTKSYEAKDMIEAEFILLQFNRIFNKIMTLLLMSIIYFIF